MDLDVSAEGDEELLCEEQSGSLEDMQFDRIVGALEEVLMDPQFTASSASTSGGGESIFDFCYNNCDIFDIDSEENKLEYTPLFDRYVEKVESTLNRMLTERVPGFDMRKFESDVASRKDEISGEIFDLLLSLGDFTEFKEMMISHKKQKLATTASSESCAAPASSSLGGLSITGTSASTSSRGRVGGGRGGGGLDLSLTGKAVR